MPSQLSANMVTLICGGRDFTSYDALEEAMKMLPTKPTILIQGGAKGADYLGKLWAILNDVQYAEVPAMWENFGKSAGFKRNAAMLLLRPEYCIALPGGVGTRMMIDLCNKANVPVWEPYPKETT